MADSTFEGEVFQIGFDADAAACTASLRNAKGTIKVTTMDGRMQSLLETAMIKSLRASITYTGNDLRSVSLDIDGGNSDTEL